MFTWNQFRKVKNQVNQEIKSVKKAYYNNAFDNYAGDQRKTRKTIYELTSRKWNKTVINEIQYQGQISSNQVEISELLNNFFIEIGQSLSGCATAREFNFEEIETTHILSLLSKVRKNRGHGQK